ncbi:hypothetical protein D9M68_922860 [compost metagenome]
MIANAVTVQTLDLAMLFPEQTSEIRVRTRFVWRADVLGLEDKMSGQRRRSARECVRSAVELSIAATVPSASERGYALA